MATSRVSPFGSSAVILLMATNTADFRGHGMRQSPEYRAFFNAKARCTNTKGKDWAGYGGAGVKVLFTCFENLYMEVGPKPEPKRKYSLGRFGDEGNYEAGNCKWMTTKEQAENRRKKAA